MDSHPRESLYDMVQESIEYAQETGTIKKQDAAAIALALDYARLVDDAYDESQRAYDLSYFTKAVAISGPNLARILESLGLTPKARGELTAKLEGEADELDALRARRGFKAAR